MAQFHEVMVSQFETLSLETQSLETTCFTEKSNYKQSLIARNLSGQKLSILSILSGS